MNFKQILHLEIGEAIENGNVVCERIPGGYVYQGRAFNGFPAFSHFVPWSKVVNDEKMR